MILPGSVQRTEHYRVNRQGERIRWTDRNQTVHEYGYDLLGRPTTDSVTTLGIGVDGVIWAITTSYDGAGRVHLVSSLDGSSNVVNQIEPVWCDILSARLAFQLAAFPLPSAMSSAPAAFG